VIPRITNPGRRATSRKACELEAINIPGRFKSDGCKRYTVKRDGVDVFVVENRKFWRSGGRSC